MAEIANLSTTIVPREPTRNDSTHRNKLLPPLPAMTLKNETLLENMNGELLPTRKRIRFKCSICERWRGYTRCAGFMGSLRPLCETCKDALDRCQAIKPRTTNL